MEFCVFQKAVANQFAAMSSRPLFRVNLDLDALWQKYQDSYPEGTNKIFRTRREYDCTCCRQFVRAVGNVVSINEKGELQSIWDIKTPEEAFNVVAKSVGDFVKSHRVEHVFAHTEKTAGTLKSKDKDANIEWNHFFVNIPQEYVKNGEDIGPHLSQTDATHQVLFSGLTSLTMESVDTVIELIEQDSLYKGPEYIKNLKAFKKIQDYVAQGQDKGIKDKEHLRNLIWLLSVKEPIGVCRIKNTSIGTLLSDLSDGKDLEQAVKAFEKMVAPSNYKRSKSLVTEKMINQAKEKVEELGLSSALHRRFAVLSDITINNVLFANRESKAAIGGDVFADLAKSAPGKQMDFDKVEEVSIEKFLENILPKAKTIELMFDSRHSANMFSLIAPEDPTARNMFKWDNNFSWSYNGELADSDLRKAVQERGGRVDGAFRFSHSWNHPGQRNVSLMDLHVFMPGNKNTAENKVGESYGNNERVGWNHRQHTRSGGVQDVDFTSEAPDGYIPVENITFPDIGRMPEGDYVCKIHNWRYRSPTQGGFKAEIEFGGQVFQYEYLKPLSNHEWVTVAVVTLKNGAFSIQHHLKPVNSSHIELWGIQSNKFHQVKAVMLSPNFWDDQKEGNKHYFFVLEGCKNPDSARGFYNEFLRAELHEHRKVFEVLASKLKTPKSDEQLSGLGFSCSQRNEVVCKVTGSFNRVIKIKF